MTVKKKESAPKKVIKKAVKPAPGEIKPAIVVGIGASAGGLEAFEGFFRNMPSKSGMAFVLVPHLAPEHKSIMDDLIKRYTEMGVSQATNGDVVKPDHVYIIPPNKDMEITGGRLRLHIPVKERGIRHPIDTFFRSLAHDKGESAICIVLSGTGSEGAIGLKEIKGEGGLALVQDPAEARYDGMPSAAISTGMVDYVLPVSKMPQAIFDYIKSSGKLVPQATQAGPREEHLNRILGLIRAQTGHDFTLYKHNTIIRRVERRMAVLQLAGMSEYLLYLRSNPLEIETLFKDLLIRVTSFFRDNDAFEALKKKALPHIFRDRQYDETVRIWVPGCSTGEEAYSLSILFLEYMREVKVNNKFQIFATDMDNGAIDAARSGIYSESIAVDVSDDRLKRYFIKKDAAFKIRDEVREPVIFSTHNLIKDPPFSRMDLISCRNVLIYMGTALQRKALPLFHYALKPGGFLFLGTSETVGDHSSMFSVTDKKWKIYRSRDVESLPLAAMELRTSSVSATAGKQAQSEMDNGNFNAKVSELAQGMLLEHYSPPCAIVNEKGDVLYFHGRTGKFLEPASGRASLNIIDMAREGLRPDLRSALRKALTSKADTTIDGVRVKSDGGYEAIDLDVRYITKPANLQGLLMVVFRAALAQAHEKGAALPGHKADELMDQRISDLEFELKSTKERLQTTIEELETTNEELKSSNEELQSSNEELQSTNEEMETSKEELQSVNEELLTVNSELQNKMEESSVAYNDMNNLLASTKIATLFLDGSMRIKRFTPEMTNVMNLIETDIGRPVEDIATKIDYPSLGKDAVEVLKTLSLKEQAVQHKSGRWYLVRILPYRRADNVINGVVITFLDITEQTRAKHEMQYALGLAEGIVETVHEPLLVIGHDLKVVTANKSFYDAFGVIPKETVGRPVYELGNRQWDIPALRELLDAVLTEDRQFEGYLVEHMFRKIGLRKMMLNARRISHMGARTETILLAIEDITEKGR